MKFQGSENYVATPDLMLAVNAAITLKRPLLIKGCLLYTSDAADERSSVDLGGRRIIKKKTTTTQHTQHNTNHDMQHTDNDLRQQRRRLNSQTQ